MNKKERTPEFKKKVALEALKGLRTLNEIAAEYQVHPTQVVKWKKQLLDGADIIFETTSKARSRVHTQHLKEEQLHAKIGQLTVELDWLKKKSGIG